MRFWTVSGAILALISLVAATPAANPAQDVDNFVSNYARSAENHDELAGHGHGSPIHGKTCKKKNARVRKSWYALTKSEKKKWIKAVKCLQKKPAITPTSIAPGARHRLDDFAASHIERTLVTHINGWFLPWHRYLVWQFETALRDECGYTGAQPYWDWTVHGGHYDKDPIFDGSATSFGGNGLYVPQERVNATMPGLPDPVFIVREPGTGGGCVPNGAFADVKINMGQKFPYGNRNSSGVEYTPHCLTRSWNIPFASSVLTRANVGVLLSQPTLADFRFTIDDRGVHTVGHDAVGGDVADLFTSPQDPLFYLHHAQVDRLWAIWQAQDPSARLYAVSDTQTMANSPPSPPAALTDDLDFGYIGGVIEMSEVVNPLGGVLCYRYE